MKNDKKMEIKTKTKKIKIQKNKMLIRLNYLKVNFILHENSIQKF